ncbi:hypothetical protein BWQ96_10321 [Gracilariopsis chorda]|uniref:Uncharacterized protein n=1 Tax=Gracilariopsis chorda TaxID=448386 RepID=A0A2V3IFL8_9FLOR|nr:hypothetical protein BWQ96_10321 [Gracilariopsis chorda]|eukprot:PXF39970.1 hypothetical protein BWQ96_10321 [Gracilariopsis chorda]
MSSSPLPNLSTDLRLWSYEEAESVDDSEAPCSSVIRLPPTTFPERSRGAAQDTTPPPLPPKPAFARVQSDIPPPLPPKPDFARIGLIPQSAPPPLPPKPHFAKVERPADALGKRRSYPFSSANTSEHQKPNDSNVLPSILPPPPSRPLPPVPRSDRKPSYGEESSWVPSFPDERSPLDPPQPPEPTILSDGDVRRSSIGMEATEQNLAYLSDQLPKLKPRLPQPPYPVQCHRVASMFQT